MLNQKCIKRNLNIGKKALTMLTGLEWWDSPGVILDYSYYISLSNIQKITNRQNNKTGYN